VVRARALPQNHRRRRRAISFGGNRGDRRSFRRLAPAQAARTQCRDEADCYGPTHGLAAHTCAASRPSTRRSLLAPLTRLTVSVQGARAGSEELDGLGEPLTTPSKCPIWAVALRASRQRCVASHSSATTAQNKSSTILPAARPRGRRLFDSVRGMSRRMPRIKLD